MNCKKFDFFKNSFLFPFSRLQQREHGRCDWSAEDVHSSMKPNPSSNFCGGPCMHSSCFESFLCSFDYEHGSLSQHLIQLVLRLCDHSIGYDRNWNMEYMY